MSRELEFAAYPGALAARPEDVLDTLAAWLHDLLETGTPHWLDLSVAGLDRAARKALRALLGEGELEASLHSLGRVEVRETALHGVWWITYRDDDGEILAERIEVCFCPEILGCGRDDVLKAQARLQRLRGSR